MAKCCVLLTLLVISLSGRLAWSQCNNEFLIEPGTASNSPLNCNLLDASVTLVCRVANQGFTIAWYYTDTRNQAGISGQQIASDDPRFSVFINFPTSPRAVHSELRISSYDRSYDGFYWCRLEEIRDPQAAFINPSTVVNISAEFSLQQLSACRDEVRLSSEGERCAQGDEEPATVIVVAAEFTNTTSTTTDAPTTTTTEMPTTADITTTGEEKVGGGGGGGDDGDNDVRKAIIWFSVGAVAFVLVTFGVILGIIACVKC